MSVVLAVESLSKRFLVERHRPSTLRESIIRRLHGHKLRRDAVWALRDITFSVEDGVALGVVGHNGAGKSTLLRLVCGLGRPTSGRITRTGQVSGLLELGGGFHLDITGRDNLMTAGLLNGLTESEVQAREEDIIAFSELEEFIDQPVRTYSTGMYLRLAFAAALCFDPAILVVDEVLAVGDSRFQQKCLERIARFRAAGKTLIIASHTREQILSLCDEVLVLDDGRAVMRSDPKTALNCYDGLMQERTERRARQLYGGRVEPSAPLERGWRQGTREAWLASVQLANAQGREVDTISSGDGVTIDLGYVIGDAVPDVAVSLGIFTDAHVKCFEVVIPSAAIAFGPLGKSGTMRCHLPSLPLLAGLYYVNVGIYPPGCDYIYDYHWQMYALHVVADKARQGEMAGVVAVSPTWCLASRDGGRRAPVDVGHAERWRADGSRGPDVL